MVKKIIISCLCSFILSCQSKQLVRNEQNESDLKHAMVVGTIHKFHAEDKTYPLQKLEDIIKSYKPDLILVEIRPEPFVKGYYEDGPFEMGYITEVAKKYNITVSPIDFWNDSDLEKQLNEKIDKKKDQQFEVEYLKIKLNEGEGSTFQQIHSPEKLAEHTRVLNLRERVYDGSGEWNQRQAWFNHNADVAITQHNGKKVLAFVGYEHKTQLQSFLQNLGFIADSPLTFSSPVDVIQYCIPKAVVQNWKDGSERLRNHAKTLGAKVRDRITSKADYFLAASKKYQDNTCKVAQ